MIEAPEALFLSEQLNQTIIGKTISDVFAQYSPHKFAFFYGDPQEYPERLTGRTITAVHARGGMIEIQAGNMLLILSDGINLRYFAPGEKLPAKHQLLIGFEDQSCLIASVRMYGGLWCFGEGGFDAPIAAYYQMAKEKPQVMTDDFDRNYFLGLINAEESQKKTAKAFLATEQTIPGLGNGVLQDILYNARIHPKTKISELTPQQREELYVHLKATLKAMYDGNGRSVETDLSGVSGHYVPHLSKDTAGKACPRCGETIKKENYLGGSIYYCSGCQVLPARGGSDKR